MSKIDKNTLKVMNIIRGKIGLKDVCVLETDEERQVVWDAIDKQTPQRPDVVITQHTGMYLKLCPHCNVRIHVTYPHCPNCGQALDWRI